MISLIGYWASVTVIVALLVVPWFYLFATIARRWWRGVLNKAGVRQRHGGYDLENKLMRPFNWPFNILPDSEGWIIVDVFATIISMVVWIVAFVEAYQSNSTAIAILMNVTHVISSHIGPFLAWPAIIIGALVGGNILISRALKKVLDVSDKLNQVMGDNRS